MAEAFVPIQIEGTVGIATMMTLLEHSRRRQVIKKELADINASKSLLEAELDTINTNALAIADNIGGSMTNWWNGIL